MFPISAPVVPAVQVKATSPQFGSRYRIHFEEPHQVEQKYVVDTFQRAMIRQFDTLKPDPATTSMYGISGEKLAHLTGPTGHRYTRTTEQHADVVVFDRHDALAEGGFAKIQQEWKNREGQPVLRLENKGKIETQAEYEQAKSELEQEYLGRIPERGDSDESYRIHFLERTNVRYAPDSPADGSGQRTYTVKEGSLANAYGI